MLLSNQEMNTIDPGYERPNIRVQPILTSFKGQLGRKGGKGKKSHAPALKNSTSFNIQLMQDLQKKIKNYDFDFQDVQLNHFHC